MIIKAYAKINIALKILGRRDDGYHILKSFMQSLPELYDILEIVESEKTEITCSNDNLSCGDDNLVAKALKAMDKNAKVHIEKRIPIAAGLAGGSADAAAVIYAFMGASDKAYSLAASIGSDIPFSLMAIQNQGRAAAIATGTGTELEAVTPIEGHIVTVTPDVAVSTPAVYKKYDEMAAARSPETATMRTTQGSELEASSQKGSGPKHDSSDQLDPHDFALSYGNDLQAPAISLCPEIQEVLDELKKPDPDFGTPIKVQQSGSGPSCFAIYR